MKISKVYKDNIYLIIETDIGIRKLKLNYSNVNEVEKKCINFCKKQCLIDYRTLKGWSKDLWFVDVWEVNEYGEKILDKDTETSSPHENLNNITLNSFNDFKNNEIVKSEINNEKFIQRIFGPPGTGKTTKLINDVVKSAINNGIETNQIAFLGYTNASCEAAVSSLGFSDLKSGKVNFPYFRTLHSMATKIGGSSFKLMETSDRYKFDQSIKFKEEWVTKGDSTSIVERPEHPVLDAWSIAIQRKEKFDHNLQDVEDVLSIFFKKDIKEIEEKKSQYVHSYIKQYLDFKNSNRLLDFDDVLLNAVDHNKVDEYKFPDLEILIIDEAQDLSNLQWDFVERLIKRSNKVYLAGDDDQAIMTSFGASPEYFKSYVTNTKDIFHKTSYRVPSHIKKYVDCGVMKDIENLDDRIQKTWNSKIDHEKGTVYFMSSNFDNRLNTKINKSDYEKKKTKIFKNFNGTHYEPLTNWTPNDLIEHIVENKFEDWLILTPTNNSAELLSKGLSKEPYKIPHYFKNKPVLGAQTFKHSINIRTIHTSKGLGADNVAIVVLSIADILMLGDDNPRLAYVALTRSKKTMIPRVVKTGLFNDVLDAKYFNAPLSNYLFRFPMPIYEKLNTNDYNKTNKWPEENGSNQQNNFYQENNISNNSKSNIDKENSVLKILKSNASMQKYIEILELENFNSIKDIRINYVKLVKKWHPDTTTFDKRKANFKIQFLKIKDAYDKIMKFLTDIN